MDLHGLLAQALVACRLMLVACRLWLVAHLFLSVVYCPCDNLSQVCKIWGVSIQMSFFISVYHMQRLELICPNTLCSLYTHYFDQGPGRFVLHLIRPLTC